MVRGVRFELTNPLRPDLKPGAFDHSATPAQTKSQSSLASLLLKKVARSAGKLLTIGALWVVSGVINRRAA